MCVPKRIRFCCIVIFSFFALFLLASCQNGDEEPTPTPQPANPIGLIDEIIATATSTATITPSATPSSTPSPEGTPIMFGLEAASVPDVVYLGEGPGSFSAQPGFNFIVKRNNPYRVDYESGPDYRAVRNERIWQIRGNAHLFLVFESEHDFGNIEGNCEITYVQIDDDLDGRRNRFYLDGVEVHLMPQGMVVNGRFTLNRSGRLTLFAEDSSAADITVTCAPLPPTSTPSPTPTTFNPIIPLNTETPTPSQIPTITPTIDGPVALTETPTPTGTAVPPTEPPSTATITPSPTPTVPVGPAYTRFNFEMAGHEGRDGFCYMRRVTGDLLLVWQMQDGWTDSSTHPDADANGWLEVYIPHVSIYVEVFCDTGEGPIRMNIHNGVRDPDSGNIVGWLTRWRI